MNKNEYSALVDKLAEEIIEGVMEKEAGVGDKLFDKIVRGASEGQKAAKGDPSKVKGAFNKIIDGINKKRSSAVDKMTDAARRAKDSKIYGVGKGMLGTSKRQSIAAASAGFGVGGAAGMAMKHKSSEGAKAAAEINEFIEKVAEFNGMDVDVTADILERVASAYQDAMATYEDSQLRKEAAGEVYSEAEADEIEAAAQLEAAVQVMEELGIPVDELLEDEGEDEEGEEGYEEEE